MVTHEAYRIIIIQVTFSFTFSGDGTEPYHIPRHVDKNNIHPKVIFVNASLG